MSEFATQLTNLNFESVMTTTFCEIGHSFSYGQGQSKVEKETCRPYTIHPQKPYPHTTHH